MCGGGTTRHRPPDPVIPRPILDVSVKPSQYDRMFKIVYWNLLLCISACSSLAMQATKAVLQEFAVATRDEYWTIPSGRRWAPEKHFCTWVIGSLLPRRLRYACVQPFLICDRNQTLYAIFFLLGNITGTVNPLLTDAPPHIIIILDSRYPNRL